MRLSCTISNELNVEHLNKTHSALLALKISLLSLLYSLRSLKGSLWILLTPQTT